MSTITNNCETVKLIALYGDKRLKKLCKKPVHFSIITYKIASQLASIDEAMYYNEVSEGSFAERRRLNRLYRKTCRQLERAIKNNTRRWKKYVKMGLVRAEKEGD